MLEYAKINRLKETAEANLSKLSATVLNGLKPPAGPYAFFNHNAHAIERIRDCGRIVERLFVGRAKMTELQKRKDGISKNRSTGEPCPEELKEVNKEDMKVHDYMKQDLETLYIFGGILLDQWSLLSIYIGRLSLKKKYPFRELVAFFESEREAILNPIWKQLKVQMLWLYYQLRFYRNRFVVHANRPWQRGTTSSIYGDEFNLFTPTPPGWIDDDKINEEIKRLTHLAPEHIKDAPDNYWLKTNPRALIEVIFKRIGYINSGKDREKVASIYGMVGGETPTFQIIAQNLFEFIASATNLLEDIARNNLDKIDLGIPYQHSKGKEIKK